ncbi:MAG: pseudouridine synthase [Myxococcales bacterium]|nr:pseudouridine synthase [Myxococcales bacterium]|tara:strand:+ start:121 stop:858 length:738 start_codon:yes stop_codon:yes gene_type:complete
MEKIRLQKALAEAGFCSRREAERMIEEGRVLLNGKPLTQQGMKIDPLTDKVKVDGKPVRLYAPGDHTKVYFLLNKPGNVLTTTKDDRGRQTVIDLMRGAEDTRIFPVGRLDFDSEGALLLTNDGPLANQLTHPKSHVPKTYMAKVKGVPPEEKLDKLRRGIYLEDGPTQPAHVEMVNKVNKNTWVEIIITEGRNRQVKRMFWRIKHPVIKLVRTHFGNLNIDGLRPGQFRELSKKELAQLRALAR